MTHSQSYVSYSFFCSIGCFKHLLEKKYLLFKILLIKSIFVSKKWKFYGLYLHFSLATSVYKGTFQRCESRLLYIVLNLMSCVVFTVRRENSFSQKINHAHELSYTVDTVRQALPKCITFRLGTWDWVQFSYRILVRRWYH